MYNVNVQKASIKTYQMLPKIFALCAILLLDCITFIDMEEQMKWVMLTFMIMFSVPTVIFEIKCFKTINQFGKL